MTHASVMSLSFTANVDMVLFAHAQPDSTAGQQLSVVEWIDVNQWPICFGLLLVCVVFALVTARQVRREQLSKGA